MLFKELDDIIGFVTIAGKGNFAQSLVERSLSVLQLASFPLIGKHRRALESEECQKVLALYIAPKLCALLQTTREVSKCSATSLFPH